MLIRRLPAAPCSARPRAAGPGGAPAGRGLRAGGERLQAAAAGVRGGPAHGHAAGQRAAARPRGLRQDPALPARLCAHGDQAAGVLPEQCDGARHRHRPARVQPAAPGRRAGRRQLERRAGGRRPPADRRGRRQRAAAAARRARARAARPGRHAAAGAQLVGPGGRAGRGAGRGGAPHVGLRDQPHAGAVPGPRAAGRADRHHPGVERHQPHAALAAPARQPLPDRGPGRRRQPDQLLDGAPSYDPMLPAPRG